MAIYKIIDLEAYQQRIDQQRSSLKHSLVFSEGEKAAVNEIYDELTGICKKRLSVLHEVADCDES